VRLSKRIATGYGTGRTRVVRGDGKQPVDYSLLRQLALNENEEMLELTRDGYTQHGLYVQLTWHTIYTNKRGVPFTARTLCVLHLRRHMILCGRYGDSYLSVDRSNAFNARPLATPEWPDDRLVQWLLGNVNGASGGVDLADWWRSLYAEFTCRWQLIMTTLTLSGNA